RAFLAERLRGDAPCIDSARDEVVDDHVGAAGTEREVVVARAALVGVALDEDAVVGVAVEPGGLLVERRLRFGGERGGIGLEEDAVPHGHEEFLLAARRAAARSEVADTGRRRARTGGDGDDQGNEPQRAQHAHDGCEETHPVYSPDGSNWLPHLYRPLP